MTRCTMALSTLHHIHIQNKGLKKLKKKKKSFKEEVAADRYQQLYPESLEECKERLLEQTR